MERLTTNKNVSEMSMYELAHNSCYAKDGKARVRDFEGDSDARELTIKLLEKYADIPNEFTCDEDFDEFISDFLQYGTDCITGLIAVFYQHIWAMADLRERLKEYEDLEEQGKLLKLPCAVGDTYFKIETAFWREEQECQGCRYYHTGSDVFRDDSCCLFEEEKWPSCAEIVEKRFESVKEVISYMEDYPAGKTVFPTHEEAEAALEKLERE